MAILHSQERIDRLRGSVRALRSQKERMVAEIERLHKLIGVIRERDRDHNLFNCASGGWIRQQIEQTFNDGQ